MNQNQKTALLLFSFYWIFFSAFSQCPEIVTSSLTSDFCVKDEIHELFISEYIESKNNKCIELFNGTSSSVDLSSENYVLKIYVNGALIPNVIELDNMIAAGNTLTICDISSSIEYLDKSDQLSDLLFDGNDVIALYHGNVLVDQIGVIGCDPGIKWNSITGQRTKNSKLIRMSTISVGTTGTFDNCNFTPLSTEWSIYEPDASTLGSHESIISEDCCVLCPNQEFTLSIDAGSNLPAGERIDWFFGYEEDFDYKLEGTKFVSSDISSGNCVPSDGGVVFNEIMVSPLHNDDDFSSLTTGEWIELIGPPGKNIGCYIVTDGDWVLRIPANTTLGADGLFLIGFDATADKPVDLDLTTCNCTYSTNFNNVLTLNNKGEYLLIFDGDVYSDALIYGNPSFFNTFPFGDVLAGGSLPPLDISDCVDNSFSLLTPTWLSFARFRPNQGESYEREPDYSGDFIAETCTSFGRCNVENENYPIKSTFKFSDDFCNDHIYIKGVVSPVCNNCTDEIDHITKGLEICISCPIVDIHTTLYKGESIEVNGTIYDENNPKGIEKNIDIEDICNTIYDIDLTFVELCPEIILFFVKTSTNCINDCTLCPNDGIQIQLNGINLLDGTVDWYLGASPNFDPYGGDGDYISSSLMSAPSIIDLFSFNIPLDLCNELGPQEYYIKGILNPIKVGCDEVTTQTFIFGVECIEPNLKTTVELCVGDGMYNLMELEDSNYSGIWSSEDVSIIEIGGEQFFKPIEIGSFVLTFTSDEKCTLPVDVVIEVLDLVTPKMETPDVLCESSSPLNLSILVDVNYPNGTWSGQGVSGNQFDPNNLSMGKYELIYEATDQCAEPVSVVIEIINEVLPELKEPLDICNDASNLNLTTLLDLNYPNGIWSGDGVNGNYFNPDGLSLGNHELIFESSDVCTETVSVMINVVDLVEPKLIQPDDICESSVPLDLTKLLDLDYPTGIWSGNGVSVDQFEPNGLPLGQYIITFSSDNICAKPVGIAINIIAEETPELGKPTGLCRTDSPLDLMDYVDPKFPTGEWSGKGVSNNTFYPVDLPQGSYDVVFSSVENCVVDASMQFDVMEATISIYEELICAGTSIELFGVTFDENHLSEDIILPVLNQFGCDSIVSVQILFKNELTAMLSSDEVCFGDIVQILVKFSDNGIHDITIFDGQNNYLYNDVTSGTIIDVLTTEKTTYNITVVEIDGCELEFKEICEIVINDIAVDIQTVANYNGYQVSCDGETDGHIIASANGSGYAPYQFLWANGKIEPSLSDLPKGKYQVTITDSKGCMAENLIILEAPEQFQSDLYIEQPNCEVETGNIEISVVNPINGPYIISIGNYKAVINGSKEVVSNLSSGHYEISIEDQNGCTTYESIDIDSIELPYFNLGEDKNILQGESIDLTTYIDFNTSEISWYPPDFLSCDNCLETVATPTNTMAYQLKLTDSNGCFYIDAITVFVKIEDRLYIPNGFTPNFDATNDVFKVHTDRNDLIIEEMAILDRWGEVVYSAKDKKPEDAVWDGSFNGKGAMQGVYGYYIVVKFPNGKRKLFEGNITLMR